MSINVKVVLGAAEYFPHLDNETRKWYVVMRDDEGFNNEIQRCTTFDACVKAADKWQEKENKAVAKAGKGE